jgi:hypothetical protein
MRTGVPSAALPRRLRWQAAFTIKHYHPLAPCIWHHICVSDAHMTDWLGGSNLVRKNILDGDPERVAGLKRLSPSS